MKLIFIDIFRKMLQKNDITYDEASLHEAFEMVENSMSIQKAAKEKLIPREILRRWVTNPQHSGHPPPPPPFKEGG